jgi:hypothetical protein
MKRILCFLPVCFNPSNRDSSNGDDRVTQYINGLNEFFKYSDVLLKYNVDVVLFDNTIEHIDQMPSVILDILPKNVVVSVALVNDFGCVNKGAGLIETWLCNKNVISKYDWLIHFEPRQLLKSFDFINSFLISPRNLFTLNTNARHFNMGLFCIDTSCMLDYIQQVDLQRMTNNFISIEDDLYAYFKNKHISFSVLDKMDLLWFPKNHTAVYH